MSSIYKRSQPIILPILYWTGGLLAARFFLSCTALTPKCYQCSISNSTLVVFSFGKNHKKEPTLTLREGSSRIRDVAFTKHSLHKSEAAISHHVLLFWEVSIVKCKCLYTNVYICHHFSLVDKSFNLQADYHTKAQWYGTLKRTK